jgi:phage-related protein
VAGRNVGEAEIIVEADASGVLPEVEGLMARLGRLGSKSGDDFGKRFSKSMDKQVTSGAQSSFARLGPIIAAGVPLAVSGLSAVAGAATALVGSLAQASVSSLALVGVAGALAAGLAITTVAFKGMGDAITGDAEALAKLGPEARASAEALGSLGGAMGAIQDRIQENVFRGLADNFRELGTNLIPMLGNQFAAMGTTVNGVFDKITRWAVLPSVVDRLRTALSNTNSIMAILGDAVRPVLNGMLNVFNALSPSAERLAGRIRDAADAFNGWTQGVGFARRVDEYMIKAERSAGLLWAVLKNVGIALGNVFNASAGAGDGLIATLGDLTARFAAWTGTMEGKNAIADWAQQGVDAMVTLGSILSKTASFFSSAFSPALFQSFLDLLVTIGPTLGTIFGVVASVVMPIFDRIGQAVAENGPKIAALFTALAPLLQGVGAIIGEVIAQAIETLGSIAGIITPVVAIISNFLGPILTKLAPIIATVILAFTNWGGTLVKLVPVVGKFLSPLVKLVEFIYKGLNKAFTLAGTVVAKVFGAIGRLIAPVTSRIVAAFQKVVAFLRGPLTAGWNAAKSIVTNVMNAIRSVVSSVWNAVVGVVKGAIENVKGAIRGVQTVVDFMRGVFERARAAVAEKITQVITLARELPGKITSALGNLGSLLYNSGVSLITGFYNGIQSKIEAAVNLVKNAADRIKGLFGGSPVEWGPLLSWNKGGGGGGESIMNLLKRGLATGIPGVIAVTQGLAASIGRNFEQLDLGPATKNILDAFTAVNAEIEKANTAAAQAAMQQYDKQIADQEKAIRKQYDGKKQEKALKKALGALEKEYRKHSHAIEQTYKDQGAAALQLAGVQRTAILGQAAQWDALQVSLEGVRGELDKALSTLDAKVQEYENFASGMVGRIVQSVFNSSDEVPITFDAIIASLTQQEEQAAAVQAALAELAAMGLNETSYQQIADMGVGGLAAAQALIASGQAGVDQVDALQGSISSYAEKAAETAADYLFGAGVNVAQGVVDGLVEREATLMTQMTTLGQQMATAFADAMATVALPDNTGGGGGGGGGGSEDGKHKWVPISKSNRKCSICGKTRGASVHTNRNDNNFRGTLSALGGWARVGETGPELVRLPGKARVYPAQQTARMEGSKDQRPVEMTVVLPTGDPEAAAMAVMNRLVGRI